MTEQPQRLKPAEVERLRSDVAELTSAIIFGDTGGLSPAEAGAVLEASHGILYTAIEARLIWAAERDLLRRVLLRWGIEA